MRCARAAQRQDARAAMVEALEGRQLLAGTGLTGVYYDNPNLTGASHTRVDATVNLNTGTSPAPGIGADTFSVAWSGSVEPLHSETYTFYATGDDGIRLWVDGRLLIDTFAGGGFGASAQVALEAGKRYAIGMDYFDNTGNAIAKLEWSSASQARQVVPAARLYPELPSAAPVKIMTLGDSITQGDVNHATYRYWLYRQLRYGGYAPDFVGSLQTHYAGSGGQQGPAPVGHFDRDHEGRWGWRVDQVLGSLAQWAQAAQPDIVLVHLGSNDIFQGQPNSQTIAELETVIDMLRAARPTVKVLLAKIIPSTLQNGAFAAAINDFNSRIAALAAAKTTGTSPVIAVDQHTGFDPAAHTYDTVHPNAAGEKLMAQKWADALAPLLASTVLEDAAVFGSAGADRFHIKLSASGQDVLVWKNQNPAADPPAHSLARSPMGRLKVFGLGGEDVLTVDYSAGDPFGAGALIEFDGGAGIDALVVAAAGDGIFSTTAGRSERGGRVVERTGVEVLELRGGDHDVQADLAGQTLRGSASASIDLLVTQHLAGLALSEGASATLAGSGLGLLRVGALEIADEARLDLVDNALVLDAAAGTKQGWHDTLFGYIASARNGSATIWGGAGLGTSVGTGSVGPALAINSVDGSRPLMTSVGGEAVGGDTVIVRLAQAGDLTFDGRVSTADYLKMDRAFGRGRTGWFNGDFDYSGGPADGGDYFAMDEAYMNQASPAAVLAPAPATAEPVSGSRAALASESVGSLSRPGVAGGFAVLQPFPVAAEPMLDPDPWASAPFRVL